MCREQAIKNIIFYDFQALWISKTAVQRCFKDVAIKIELVENPAVGNNKPDEKAEYSSGTKQNYAVNKIRLSGTVKGDAKEDNPRDQVSIMTKNKVYMTNSNN